MRTTISVSDELLLAAKRRPPPPRGGPGGGLTRCSPATNASPCPRWCGAHSRVATNRRVFEIPSLCDEADASSDLISDAVIAAVAVEHGGQVISLDHDFARFSSVRHTRPPLG